MNYNKFFGFSESPFLDDPDPRFFFPSNQQESALAELAGFISTRQGIALVSGDDGVGKTMLVHTLMERLPSSCHPLVITRPAQEPLAITLAIAENLGLPLRDRNLVKLTPFAEAVQAAAQEGRYLVLIVDDAQVLTDQHLEEVYILSQMEHQGRQLIPIILAGRKGLVQKVASKANQRLQELVRHTIVLTGLTFEETTRYIDHRLQKVGSSFKACFADGCAGQIFSRTGGIPRRLNQVCDQALARAFQENRPRVSRDLLGEEESAAPFKPLVPPAKWESSRYGLLVAGVLAVCLALLIIYSTSSGPGPSQTSPPPVAQTTATPAKPLPLPDQEKSPSPAATVSQAQPQVAVAEKPAGQQVSPPPANPVAPAPETREAGGAEASRVNKPEEQASEPESNRPATHQVTREDNLLKIVATYYPDNKEFGYDAVILANPRINDEDIIYSGQIIALPKLDKGNIITLDNKEYFRIFGRYYSSSQAEKVGARLKELQLRYVVRATELPDATKVYRIFLGGYERKDELKKAMTLIGNY